jgi:hypothetical protein
METRYKARKVPGRRAPGNWGVQGVATGGWYETGLSKSGAVKAAAQLNTGYRAPVATAEAAAFPLAYVPMGASGLRGFSDIPARRGVAFTTVVRVEVVTTDPGFPHEMVTTFLRTAFSVRRSTPGPGNYTVDLTPDQAARLEAFLRANGLGHCLATKDYR